MSICTLTATGTGVRLCPTCGGALNYVEGGVVRLVNGKPDMEAVKPKYECFNCSVFYREVLNTGLFDVFPLEKAPEPEKPKEAPQEKKIVSTGDIQPVMLKADSEGKCKCPRCGEMMHYVDAEAVKIVDGRADLENVRAHFECDSCNSVFRRIVNTDFFQWAEK